MYAWFGDGSTSEDRNALEFKLQARSGVIEPELTPEQYAKFKEPLNGPM